MDNTAVPLPFEIYATVKTVKYEELEKNLHKTIDRLSDLRIRQNREFFNISPDQALELIKDIAALTDDAEIESYRDGKPIKMDDKTNEKQITKKVRPPFKFSMVNIPIGSTITFIPTGLEVRVASDNMVEYQGRLYKLSPFVGTFLPEEQRNNSGAYQGSKYFSYKGEILNDIRTRLEINE